MTDAEAVAVLRRLHDTDFDALPDELAAIERAIVLLEREASLLVIQGWDWNRRPQ